MPQFLNPRFPRNPRDATADRGYGAIWHRLRRIKLARNPLCEECEEIASQVDHIVALSKGGSNSLDNLRSLCATCHSKKTVAVDGGLGRKRKE